MKISLTPMVRMYFVLYLLVFFVLSLSLSLSAQEAAWDATYGGPNTDRGRDIVLTSEGDYVIAGSTDTVGWGDLDLYLLKIDPAGNEIWSHNYGSALAHETGYSLAKTVDGGYIIAGDILVRTDSLGNEIWTQPISGRSILQLPGDNYLITGYIYTGEVRGEDVKAIKINGAGKIQWSYTYGTANSDRSYAVAPAPGGSGFMLAGSTDNSPYDIYLVRISSTGDSLWAKAVDPTFPDNIYAETIFDISPTLDGNYIMTGMSNFDLFLVKINQSGNILWTKTYGSANDDFGGAVKPTSDSGFIIIGSTDPSGFGEEDFFLVKTDSLGDTLWTNTFGTSGNQWGWGVVETAEGWYALTGYNDAGVYVVKVLPAPLVVQVFSPINIMVQDPILRYYGKDADGVLTEEIPDGSYIDGPIETVTIEVPIEGTYIIEFITETGADPQDTYSASIRIDGTQQVFMVADQQVPEVGVSYSFQYEVEEGFTYTNGDANRDGGVNVGDAVFLINYVFKGGPGPNPVSAGDANCDTGTNVGDAVYIINFVFKGGPEPCAF